MRVLSALIDISSNAFVAAGSQRKDFPDPMERALLGIAASRLAAASPGRQAEEAAASQAADEIRQQALQQESLDASRVGAAGEVVIGIGHELSQPLTVVVNSLSAAHRLLVSSLMPPSSLSVEAQSMSSCRYASSCASHLCEPRSHPAGFGGPPAQGRRSGRRQHDQAHRDQHRPSGSANARGRQ